MNKPLCINTTICSEYQKLLEECQSALEIWDDHRAEVSNSRLVGREAGDELLRLQAKFARAYAVLQRHPQDCPLCQMVSTMEGRDSENSWARKKEKSNPPHARPAYGAPKTYLTENLPYRSSLGHAAQFLRNTIFAVPAASTCSTSEVLKPCNSCHGNRGGKTVTSSFPII